MIGLISYLTFFVTVAAILSIAVLGPEPAMGQCRPV